MAHTQIGILGLGFTGATLARDFAWHADSWFTHRPGKVMQAAGLRGVAWDWADEVTWENLPPEADVLALTIAPILKEPAAEIDRLRRWGDWMGNNRPGLRRLIYISTTGVYPDRDGLFSEQDGAAESPSASLRLGTEAALADYFDLQVARPGGIYGPGRNLGSRIIDGHPIPDSDRPVHRIHVADLAGAIHHLATSPAALRCVNVVDAEPASSKAVALWLTAQPWFRPPVVTELRFTDQEFSNFKDKANPAGPAMNRRISNDALLRQLGHQLRHPTFREGLAACFEQGTF